MCRFLQYILGFDDYGECELCIHTRPLYYVQHKNKTNIKHLICNDCYTQCMEKKICPWCRTEIVL